MCDSVTVVALLEEVELELGDYYARHVRHFDEVHKRCQIKIDPTQLDKATDVNRIELFHLIIIMNK